MKIENIESINISDKEFKSYQRLKESGKINMFRIAKVSEKTNMSKEKIWYIMRNYDALIRWKVTNRKEVKK